MTPDATSRTEQRVRLREQRLSMPASMRIAAAQALSSRVGNLLADLTPGDVGGYWAMGGELSLHAVLLALPQEWRYCLPLLHDHRGLRFARWSAGDSIEPNRFGIPEPHVPAIDWLMPDQLQAVLVPLLGFDRRGNRLGMGGGWYDRSFAFRQVCAAPPLLIGIGYASQELDCIQTQPWDVAMDFIATEHELIDCRHVRQR